MMLEKPVSETRKAKCREAMSSAVSMRSSDVSPTCTTVKCASRVQGGEVEHVDEKVGRGGGVTCVNDGVVKRDAHGASGTQTLTSPCAPFS